MLGTYDTMYICYNIDLVGIPVASPPRTGATTAIVIADRFSAAYATTALFAFGSNLVICQQVFSKVFEANS